MEEILVCVCLCVFSCISTEQKGMCGFLTGALWELSELEGGGGGGECWDKPLNFDLERQAASGLKTGEEDEGLVCHSLETSWCLFIIILNILCFMGDGHNLLLSFYWYLLNKCLLAIQMV